MSGTSSMSGTTSMRGHIPVLLTEAVDGGWGLSGRAHTNQELIAAARAEIAALASEPPETSGS